MLKALMSALLTLALFVGLALAVKSGVAESPLMVALSGQPVAEQTTEEE